MISIQHDFKKLKKHLDGIKRDQIPFAAAMALNSLSEIAREEIRDEFKDELTIRNEGQLKRGISTVRAKKKDWPFSTAYVGILEKFEYLTDHIEGDTRHARTRFKGQRFRAIPNPKVIKRTTKGKIYKASRPGKLLDKKSFIHEANGKAYIVQEKPKGKLKFQYRLKPQANIKAQVKAESRVSKILQSRFNKEFGRALAKAIRTAR